MQDLRILEQHGVFISQLGQFVKGSVQCLIADSLGAYGIVGFVKSFLVDQYAGFVLEINQNFRLKMSSQVLFQLRTREIHDFHVQSVEENATICCGVKNQCVLTEHLSHFHVSTGYPPDIVHNLFDLDISIQVGG